MATACINLSGRASLARPTARTKPIGAIRAPDATPHATAAVGAPSPAYAPGRVYSASHFSHFLAYLSSSCDRSRMTNVSTTVAKNCEARFSFLSAAERMSAGKAA